MAPPLIRVTVIGMASGGSCSPTLVSSKILVFIEVIFPSKLVIVGHPVPETFESGSGTAQHQAQMAAPVEKTVGRIGEANADTAMDMLCLVADHMVCIDIEEACGQGLGIAGH